MMSPDVRSVTSGCEGIEDHGFKQIHHGPPLPDQLNSTMGTRVSWSLGFRVW